MCYWGFYLKPLAPICWFSSVFNCLMRRIGYFNIMAICRHELLRYYPSVNNRDISAGGLWVRKENRTRPKNVDLLRNAGIRSPRNHPQQRSRSLGGPVVVGNPHVRTVDWRVSRHQVMCVIASRHFSYSTG